MTPSLDAAVAVYVAKRHRVIALDELERLGGDKDDAKRRVKVGRWSRLHVGVYLVGAGEPTPWARCRAAALAIGDDARVSHVSSLALYHVCPLPDGPVHVTTPRKLSSRDGIEVHWSRHPPATRIRHGIPTTTLGRALADAAELRTASEMEPLLRSAQRLHRVDRRTVPDIPGRRGRKRARGGTFARGHLVRQVLTLLRENGLPEPQTEYELLGYEIDLAWPQQRVALEIDDYETHDNRDAMDADRARDRRLISHGWKPLRATSAQLDDALVADLRAQLQQ